MLQCVKHIHHKWWLSCRDKSVGVSLAALVISFVPMFSYAAIYKCIDARGRVLIGDQPCVVYDVAVGVKERAKEALPAIGVATAAGKDVAQTEREQALLAREHLEQKIHLKHNSECRDMRIQLKKQGHFVSSVLLLEPSVKKDDKLTEVRYQQYCLTQVKDIVVLDQAQKDRVSAEKARKAACDIKTREYEKRKLQLSSASSDLEINAFAVLQAEVKRGCR